MAGATNSGPITDSRSSHPRSAAARERPRGTEISSARTAIALAGHDLFHFGLGPENRVLVRGAGHRLRQHVREDVRVGDELNLVRGRRRPAVGVILHTLA